MRIDKIKVFGMLFVLFFLFGCQVGSGGAIEITGLLPRERCD